MIKLKGELDLDLTKLGLRSGDEINSHTLPASNGAIYFEVRYNGTTQNCVVWSDNYELIDSPINKPSKRHRWIEDAMPVDDFPHEVYKISQCTKCGLLRLHGLQGNNYSKKYLRDGLVSDKLPECKTTKENEHEKTN